MGEMREPDDFTERLRQDRDRFVELLRHQILAAYGLDQMDPQQQAEFDAYGRMVEAMRQEEQAFIQLIQEDARRFAEQFSDATGVPIAFEPDPADRLPRRRNPRIGCKEYPGGTWIHGRPHDCPRSVRGLKTDA